jgi:outer membrane biosynthesis protein TonB
VSFSAPRNALRFLILPEFPHVNRLFALALSLSLPVAAAAQTPPPPAPPKSANTQPRASLISRPSLEPVQQAFLASRIRSVKAVLVVDYDANGVPTGLRLDPPSGNAELDAAIIEWGRQARVTPGKAGSGRLPFDLSNDELDAALPVPADVKPIAADRIALRPPLQPLSQALVAAGGSSARYEFLLFFDAEGRVIDASIVSGARSDGVDRSALEWARQVRLKPGAAGAGLLRVDVLGSGGARTP